ncbi:MAG: glycoside hydrolase family 127 protein, partial [Proteobacteria bacterium]|nr:glycoside hydrolase family 127 protein [Pseudomonadota bacterium]
DYRLNVYFSRRGGVLVNLYQPSTLNWAHDGARISLTQRTDYPFDAAVSIEVTASKPVEFVLELRVPSWASGATVAVNGKRWPAVPQPGTFLGIRRTWRSGDRVELELPLNLRLEPIDARHPTTVALLRGPQVLFAITDKRPVVTARQLLAAKRTAKESWQVGTASGPMTMLPFSAIGEQQYSTYVVTRADSGRSREEPPT